MCLPYTIEQLRTTYEELEDSHRSLETPRRPWSRARSSPAWANWPPASPTRSTTRSASCCCTPTCCWRSARTTPQQARTSRLIVDQANRCKRIISGLLNFARQSRVVRQPTDVAELVGEVLRTLPFAEDVSVEVVDHLDDPMAEIDSDQIVQVLTNLLTNAQQAMPDGGDIAVTLRRHRRRT